MKRRTKKILKSRVNFTLNPKVYEQAIGLAYEGGESLSGMVERLLRTEIARAIQEEKENYGKKPLENSQSA